ncbi:hypothetical protein KC349_g216 [Hortaea werneckii]|nr:hypothetical protein KC349_g216 [Hortaea werneckii]
MPHALHGNHPCPRASILPPARVSFPRSQFRLDAILSQRLRVDAELVDHLRDAGDVVVTTADEANKRFPGILLQYPYASKLGRFFGKIGIGCGPLFVELGEVRGEVKGEDAIVKGHGPDAGVILAPSEGLAAAEGGVNAEFTPCQQPDAQAPSTCFTLSSSPLSADHRMTTFLGLEKFQAQVLKVREAVLLSEDMSLALGNVLMGIDQHVDLDGFQVLHLIAQVSDPFPMHPHFLCDFAPTKDVVGDIAGQREVKLQLPCVLHDCGEFERFSMIAQYTPTVQACRFATDLVPRKVERAQNFVVRVLASGGYNALHWPSIRTRTAKMIY